MNKQVLKLYQDAIDREIEKLIDGRFTGNVSFQYNFKEGSIANVNSNLNRSFRFTESDIKT